MRLLGHLLHFQEIVFSYILYVLHITLVMEDATMIKGLCIWSNLFPKHHKYHVLLNGHSHAIHLIHPLNEPNTCMLAPIIVHCKLIWLLKGPEGWPRILTWPRDHESMGCWPHWNTWEIRLWGRPWQRMLRGNSPCNLHVLEGMRVLYL